MKAPQIITIIIYAISIGMHLAKHGKPQEGSYNFIIALVGTAIQFSLLWWGGFFG